MKAKQDWAQWVGLLLAALFVWFLFATRPDPSQMTDEQRAEAAYEMRAGQMQN